MSHLYFLGDSVDFVAAGAATVSGAVASLGITAAAVGAKGNGLASHNRIENLQLLHHYHGDASAKFSYSGSLRSLTVF